MKSTLNDLMEGRSEEGDDTVVIDRADEAEAAPPDEGSGGAGPDDNLLDEEDYLPHESGGRMSKLTLVLLAALVCAVGVFGGVQVQKYLGGASAAASALPAGMPGGGMGPGRAPGGGSASTGADAPSGQGSSGTGGGTLAVVGTVAAVADTTLTVTDLGGTRHKVTVTKSTPLATTVGSPGIAKGNTVSVNGTKQSDGTITATSITVR